MQIEKLDYQLPAELIAQKPIAKRSASRLLVLSRQNKGFIDTYFNHIAEFLKPGDLLVLNDTKVLQARFFAVRKTGAKLEGLFLNQLPEGGWQVMLKGARKVKQGECIDLLTRIGEAYCQAELAEKLPNGNCILKPESDADSEFILEQIGYPPLPPYIKRDDSAAVADEDRPRYQTVYACQSGAVAAPTAGLHFTHELLAELKAKGIKTAYVTLHVGAGTFKPVTAENLDDHEMHFERFSIDRGNAALINQTKKDGGRIIAVGTTSVRTLEAVGADGTIKETSGETDLFIQPGFEFKIIDAMITNFHLPKSTLLALVGAFGGLDQVLAAYRHAIEEKYRFYSYGDAMLII